MKNYSIAVVGATGLVGRTMLQILAERNFPVGAIRLFASERSAGKPLLFAGKEHPVFALRDDSFPNQGLDFALFSAGGGISKKFIPLAAAAGVTCIDNSSAWRMEQGVPLVVPEVNPQALAGHKGIIANPNCSTIQVVVPLKPLHDAFKLKRVIYSTYQSVSGSGQSGIDALAAGLKGEPRADYPIADNCIPQIGAFITDGYTEEEEKMIAETRKILVAEALPITATTVRVPVAHCHCVGIVAEFYQPFELAAVSSILKSAPGVVLLDDPERALYPLPTLVAGKDAVYVGRVRRDPSAPNSLHLWTVADNTRKGAATNAIQIAELLAANNYVN